MCIEGEHSLVYFHQIQAIIPTKSTLPPLPTYVKIARLAESYLNRSMTETLKNVQIVTS